MIIYKHKNILYIMYARTVACDEHIRQYFVTTKLLLCDSSGIDEQPTRKRVPGVLY